MATARGPLRLAAVSLILALLCGSGTGLLGLCGPFTDVSDPGFCPFVLEIFYLGITTGTSPTTFDPTSNVTRLQMAAFLARTVDRTLARGSRRAALDQFWTTKGSVNLGLTTVGDAAQYVRSDGTDLWVTQTASNSVARVRPGDGKLLETWTGATAPTRLVAAMGRILVLGALNPGRLYSIDPAQAPSSVTTVASSLGGSPFGIAFDGSKIWTSNQFSVSIVSPGPAIAWTTTTVSTGFSTPAGIAYDGSNIWVADFTPGTLLKLDAAGAVLLTVTLGSIPRAPFFDGTNLWVSNAASNSLSIVRPSNGVVLATLTGNGLNSPNGGAFDGERVLITAGSGDVMSLWKAADFTPIGSVNTGLNTSPFSACSDGVYFWIVLADTSQLARF